MGTARILLRLPLLALSTSGLYALWLLTRPTSLVSRAAGLRSHGWIVATWARSVLWILGVRLEVRGPCPLPPFFLVSNHLSYMDIPVMLSRLDANFLAKSDIASWPLLGWLARSTGTLFVDRAQRTDLKRVIPEVRAALASGRGVIVFPEGTSTMGAEVLPFRPSIFDVPSRAQVRVSVACVHYSTRLPSPPAHLSVCWWGTMEFLPHFFELMRLPRLEARLSFSADSAWFEDRKQLALDAHRRVAELFEPVIDPALAEEIRREAACAT